MAKLWATELPEVLRVMSMSNVLKVGVGFQDTQKNQSSFKFKPILNDKTEVFLQ